MSPTSHEQPTAPAVSPTPPRSPELPSTMRAATRRPVSYTHLDVYKRQRRGWARYRSSNSATVSRSSARMAGPTLPRRCRIRVVAIDLTCWHCAADGASRPLASSGLMSTSVPLGRIVRVSGTTWTTFGPPRRMRPAVRTTARRRSPASLPAGVPRSTSTTSPGVSIEPRHLVVGEFPGPRWTRDTPYERERPLRRVGAMTDSTSASELPEPLPLSLIHI